MNQTIDYYFTPRSPWAYLGEPTLMALRDRYQATVVPKPVDIKQLFRLGGALPLAERPLAKQLHRKTELARWSQRRGLPLDADRPPVDDTLACLLLTAASAGTGDGLALAHAMSRAHWAEGRAIDDPAVLLACGAAVGLDGEALLAAANHKRTWLRYQQHTDEAIQRHGFGVPSYWMGGELFWGQDRLDFLEERLQAGATGLSV